MISAATAVQRALDLLRTSADWRNDGHEPGRSLQWPCAVNLAPRALREALEALEPARWPQDQAGAGDDARADMAWFNGLSPGERRHWFEVANSALPADA